ncbi:MAG: TolC family protein [Myxococcales bacterium]|nr:TolC family protein [Myxococcales bacterium]
MKNTRGAASALLLLLLMLAASSLASGCQTYTRRPVHVEQLVRQWQQQPAATVKSAIGRGNAAVRIADGVDVREAAIIAGALHPTVRLASVRAGVAHAGRTAAGRWPDPQFNGIARRGTGAPNTWMTELDFRVVIPLSSAPAAARSRAKFVARAAGHDLAAVSWQASVSLRRAWLAWWIATRRRRVLTLHVKTLKPLVTASRALASGGEVSVARSGVAELALLDSERRLANAHQTETLTRRAVLRAMGLFPSARVRLLVSAGLASISGDEAETRSTDAAIIRKHHPTAHAALARYEAAEQALRGAIAQQIPSLSIGPSLERTASGVGIGLGVGLPISLVTGSYRAIARARARRIQRGRQWVTTVQQLVADASDARVQLRLAESRLQTVRTGLIPAVNGLLKRLAQLAKSGELDPLLIQNVLTRARAARLAELEAQRAVGGARIALNAALGRGAPVTSQAARDGANP